MMLLALIAALISAAPIAAKEAPSIIRIETESPCGDTVIQHCWLNTGGEQIWLASSTDFSKRHLLFETERNAKVLLADEEEWLALNDHWGSNGSSLILYKKLRELDYRKEIDLTGEAWDFFCKQHHISQTGFDHSYVEALRWIEQPRAILLELSGHLDGKHHVESWLCIYYIDSKKFSTDLDELNKKHVTLPDEKH